MKIQLENLLKLKKARREVLNNSSFASFDPVTFGLDLSTPYRILNELKLKEDEKTSVAFLRATYLHERVHWLQFTGSSIGLLKQIIQIHNVSLLKQLISEGDFAVPLKDWLGKLVDGERDIEKFVARVSPENQDNKSHSKLIMEGLLELLVLSEYLDYIIDGTDRKCVEIKNPEKAITQVLCNIFLNMNLNGLIPGKMTLIREDEKGKQIEQPFELNVKNLMAMFKIGFENQKPYFMELEKGSASYFSSFHIFESQARMIDMNKLFRSLLHEKKTMDEANVIINKYISQKPYSIGFDFFLKFFDVDISLDEKRIFFLIATDYSINPVVPPIHRNYSVYLQGMNDLLPQNRFITICAALKRAFEEKCTLKEEDEFRAIVNSGEGGERLDVFNNLADYNKWILLVYGWIKDKTGYPTPIEVAQMYLDVLKDPPRPISIHSCGPNVIPYSLFELACRLRIEQPVYFVDCALMEANDRKLYLECCRKFQYFLFKEADQFQSKYPKDTFETIISHQILSKFINDIINENQSDLSFFCQYEGITKEFILQSLQSNFSTDISNLIIL